MDPLLQSLPQRPGKLAERQSGGKILILLCLPSLLPSGLLLGPPETSLWPSLVTDQRVLKSFNAEKGWQSQMGLQKQKDSRHTHPGKGKLSENGISYQNASFPFVLPFCCQRIIRAEVRVVKKELDSQLDKQFASHHRIFFFFFLAPTVSLAGS